MWSVSFAWSSSDTNKKGERGRVSMRRRESEQWGVLIWKASRSSSEIKKNTVFIIHVSYMSGWLIYFIHMIYSWNTTRWGGSSYRWITCDLFVLTIHFTYITYVYTLLYLYCICLILNINSINLPVLICITHIHDSSPLPEAKTSLTTNSATLWQQSHMQSESVL